MIYLKLIYILNISVILLVFDLSNRNSFVNLNKWLRDISYYSHDKVIIKLIGNKCDKPKAINVHEIKEFCINNNLSYEVIAVSLFSKQVAVKVKKCI